MTAAVGFGIALPLPASLPSVALGSSELLRIERSLAFLYAFLLVLVPLIRGLQGQLPIELSTRGARWQETTVASEAAIEALDGRVDVLGTELGRLATALPELVGRIEQLEGPVD